MNNKRFNIFVTIFSLTILAYGLILYFSGHTNLHELFRLIALSYALFVYGILSIKNVLSGKIFYDAFKITMLVYVVFYIVFLLASVRIWEDSTTLAFKGLLTKTEYFLMVLISIVAIKTKWLKDKQN